MSDAFEEWICGVDLPYGRPEDYYDLIQLPNGRHVPVPIAKRLVGSAIVEEIPMSRKVRDSKFFYCLQCDKHQTKILEEDGEFYEHHPNCGYSFFKCKQHNPQTEEDNRKKEAMLVRLILGGLYKTLRYVQAGYKTEE
jgi:hypothetical protein